MRVARIEIFGFKSFMERLILPLDSGITGVVGPNGCGKSNIVDAIRWVLGETRASNLRGDILEDVIFNGTENLRPLGLAEVTVTLRSQEKDFFADLVSPTLEAEAYSQSILQELSNSSERVAELAQESDAMVHPAEGNDSTIENSAAENSAAENSAAENSAAENSERPKLTVIQGQRGKPRDGAPSGELPRNDNSSDSASPVPSPLTFMSRFAWLKATNEVQVTRRLYRNGESEFFINRVPCRLKDMKDLFRAVGLSARAYTVVAQGEVSRIVTAKPEERRLILEDAAGVAGFRDKIAAANRRLEDTAVNVSRIDDLIGEVSRQVSILKKQAARARDRQALKDEIAVLDRKLYEDTLFNLSSGKKKLDAELEQLRSEEMRQEAELAKVHTLEQEARSSLLSVDVATDEVRSKIDSIREELSNRARQRSGSESRIQELRALSAAAEKERQRLSERLDLLLARLRENESELKRAQTEDDRLGADLEKIQIEKIDGELIRLQKHVDQGRAELAAKQKELRELRDQVVSHKSALSAIQAQLRSATSLENLPEALMDVTNSSTAGEIRVLGDCIKVKATYAKAVQAVLGRHAEFLVCKNARQVAQYFCQFEKAADDVRGFGVFERDCREKPQVVRGSVPGRPLIDFISVDSEFAPAVRALFHNVMLVDTAEEAFRFFSSSSGSEITFVSLVGEIITERSFQYIPGDGGIVQLRALESETIQLCVKAEDEHDHLAQEIQIAEVTLNELIQSQTQLMRTAQEQNRSMVELKSAIGAAHAKSEAMMNAAHQVQEDISRVKEEIADNAGRLENYRIEELRVLDELKSLVPENEMRIKEELESLRKEHLRLDGQRREGHEKLSTFALNLDSVRRSLDEARAKLSQHTLSGQKVALELNALKERVVVEYGEEFWSQRISALEPRVALAPEERDEMAREAAKLKSRLVREGEVDPESIQRFEEENTRLENLVEQRDDLQAAADTLKKTVQVLTETSEQRFRTTFDAVRRNFSELMPRLFGGGKADLELSDPDKPLDAGVEISVRPPGKKLRSIELLSGGEKALCATALIFSMFMVRPSPLCVLDEVDAPLDDANLVRLLSLVREMSKQTQFVMITHNKQSMAVADRLIGVTMQQPGASRVLSVSLQDAFSQVA